MKAPPNALTSALSARWAAILASACSVTSTNAGRRLDINRGHQSERTGIHADTLPAGREGVKNKNIDGLVRWEFAPMQSLEFEAGYSRRGNLYAGDTQNTNSNDPVKENYGKETNRLYATPTGYRTALGTTVTTSNWAQYERTRNSRKADSAGGTEGIFNSNQFTDIDLADVMLHSEVSIPFDYLVNQNLTLGSEWNQQRMKITRPTPVRCREAKFRATTAPAAARTRRRKSSRCSPRTTWS